MSPSQMDSCSDLFLETTESWCISGTVKALNPKVLPGFEKVQLPYPIHPLDTCLVIHSHSYIEFLPYDKNRVPSILAAATERADKGTLGTFKEDEQ